jgi:hypothetical protein
MAEINKIQAVDNHTHVPKVVGREEKDDDFDALPCSGYLEPSDDPAMARPDNPLFLEAWRKLDGYKDKSPQHVRELMGSKRRVAREQGDNFPVWVLDQLGTEYRLRLGFRSVSDAHIANSPAGLRSERTANAEGARGREESEIGDNRTHDPGDR